MKLGRMQRLAITALASLMFVSCGDTNSTTQRSARADVTDIPQVDVITVQSKKLETTTTLPAELMPYEAVDLFAKETGFIKSIRVDRGTKVKEGELIAVLEAPELVAQRSAANARYQGAESQLAAGEAKSAADQATYQRMSNAAKTPGVVAANDLEVAEKNAQADEANVTALKRAADAAQAYRGAMKRLQQEWEGPK